MERIVKLNNELKLKISDVVMNGEVSDPEVSERLLKEAYKSLEEVNQLVAALNKPEEKRDVIMIPHLPKGEKYNPYPRMMYIAICELYSKDKYFTISDLMSRIGSSRNQVRLDLKRLEQDGFIKSESSYIGERSTVFYKYKPTRL